MSSLESEPRGASQAVPKTALTGFLGAGKTTLLNRILNGDAPERRAVLQVVGKRVDLTLENEWGDRTPRTQIVAIGAYGTLNDASLREKFDRCLMGTSDQYRPVAGK